MKIKTRTPFITKSLIAIILFGVIAHASIPCNRGNHSLSNRPILVSTPFLDQCSGAALVAEKIISPPLTLHADTTDYRYHVKPGVSVSIPVNKRPLTQKASHVTEGPILDRGDFENYAQTWNETNPDLISQCSDCFPTWDDVVC